MEDSDDDDVDSWLLVVPLLLLAVSFLGPDDEEELRRLPLDEIIMDGRSKVMRSCVAAAAGAPPRFIIIFIIIETLLEPNTIDGEATMRQPAEADGGDR